MDTHSHVEFTASRRETKKMLNSAFVACLREIAKKKTINIKISIKPPHEEKGLQIADVVCWSTYQKYELQNEHFYDIITPLIKEEVFFSSKEKPYMHATP